MFRWRSPLCFSLRLLQTHSVKTESLLNQLKTCTTEYQVFQLLGMNRSALTVHHVGYAVNLLWNFYEGKPEKCRTFGRIQDHPEFIALCSVAHNKINLLDDKEVVDILYNLTMFQLEAHNSLMQQLVVEGWRRLERMDIPTLAKFSICLAKQRLKMSPLMGQIASAVSKNLEDADDPVALSCLLACLLPVSSRRLEERLIEKIEPIVQNIDLANIHHAVRLIRLFYKYRLNYDSCLEKFESLCKQNIDMLDAKLLPNIACIYYRYKWESNNLYFPLIAKPRLIEMIETCTDPDTFAELFTVLTRMESPHIRDRLEQKLLIFLDEINLTRLVEVPKAMALSKSKNDVLVKKISTLLRNHLDNYVPVQLIKITENLVQLPIRNDKLFKELQRHLQRNLLASFVPSNVVIFAKALGLLDLHQLDDAVLFKIEAVIHQSTLHEMEDIAILLMQLSETHRRFGNHHKPSRKILQKLKSCALERLQHMDNIDLLLDEIRFFKTSQWVIEELEEGLLDTCQRLLHQVTWRNITKLSNFFGHVKYARAPLLHMLAAVTMSDITKIHPARFLAILHPFSVMSYEPPQGIEFFNVCSEHVLEHKDLLSPLQLLRICYKFSSAGHFPKELINAIFNISFLRQLDAQLTFIPDILSSVVRKELMRLNRAVCIEHPEYKVPWFHDQYCKNIKKTDAIFLKLMVQKLLEEILGGKQYTRVLVTAPFYYSIDFEFTLDKKKKPIQYQKHDSAINMCEPYGLQGAQKYAVNLLHSTAFLRNTHLKRKFLVKKRHLEILGYRVIQIPASEFNLLRKQDRLEYLRKKINACS